MDRLCGVSVGSRSPKDAPDPQRFLQLLKNLSESDHGVKDWTDKFVAHASTFESRQALDPRDRELSLARLWCAECVIVKVAQFVSMNFLNGTNYGGVPLAEFDQFEHLDQPFAANSTREVMEHAWQEHCKGIDSCDQWFWDKLLVEP